MNAMLVFVMAAQGILAAFVNGWYYETQDKTLVSSIHPCLNCEQCYLHQFRFCDLKK